MTETVTQTTTLNTLLEQATKSAQPAWLTDFRAAARARFAALGWPTTKQEDWRQTNLKAVSQQSYGQAQDVAGVDAASLKNLFLDEDTPRLVFVDGVFAANLSQTEALPADLTFQPLSQADSAASSQLGASATADNDALAALNGALLQDGVWLAAAKGASIAQTLHILHLATEHGNPLLTAPRHLIQTGANASLTVVEDYVSLGANQDLILPVTEVDIADGSSLTHVVRGLGSETSTLLYGFHARQGRDSRLSGHHLLTDGGLTRSDVRVQLAGTGGDATINGLMLGHNSQHTDINIRIEHAQPHCTSHQLIKGIFDDKARGVFSGCIVVAQDAQKTDAKQTNRNLLLSDEARAHTKPQLEIYADDVKCAHGATTGQLDEDALYYLMARGIDRQSALNLLIYAFAHQVLDNMPLESVRQQAEVILAERFQPDR